MHSPPLPQTKDVVLIGGGHAHALVLLKWGMRPLPGARLTVINPGPTAPYSGMLPGFVAGHYRRGELDIDLVRLARFAGARVILGSAHHLDSAAKEVHVSGRPPIAFDVASIDVGITSEMPDLKGFPEYGTPAKPLGVFARSWDDFRMGTGPARIAVIGGGVAGAELVLAMAHALKARGRLAQATLIDRGIVLSGATSGVRQRLLRAFAEYGVTVVENNSVDHLEQGVIHLSDGREVLADFVTGAAGARPHEWLTQSGLDLHEGFVTVTETLQSSDPAILAAGDCAHLSFAPRPKAGVYAVRQAPILFHNLRALITGDPLRRYHPQKDYLKLISMGGKEALGERIGRHFSGPLIWKWKDRIDQNFMDKFRDLPEMETPEIPAEHTSDLPETLGDKPLCGGCGAKAGRGTLNTVLAQLPPPHRTDIQRLSGEDAAVLNTGSVQQVISTDHLRSFLLDPYMMTRIAAVHALGDIWAMGAEPQAATANIILPRSSRSLQERSLGEIMQAANDVMAEAGAAIAGGHTSIGDELTIGFTVTGICTAPPITLAGAQPGDALILTKPLGTGILMAAEMAGLARGEWVAEALTQMTMPQADAAKILADAHAMTDVTGFGLAGHLLGMCEASEVGARLVSHEIPLLEGVEALATQRVRSTLYDENAALIPDLRPSGGLEALFDPQTAGGLLAAVAADEAPHLLKQLKTAGYTAAHIGQITQGPPRITLS